MMERSRIIYTIGHSTHELVEFVRLLLQHGVTAVADVRSQPYGRLEHFRRENLEAELKAAKVDYVFLGRELGARREEPECYIDGQVSYDRAAELPAFRRGLERLERGTVDHVIALMCAEREPLDCHRTVLLARQLSVRGWQVRHILVDGSIEEHSDTEQRLVEEMGVDPLFDSDLTKEELIERAYEERGRELAYRPTKEEP